ncbi:MAG: tetratricopeptide (TPR) repeat protein, partial [Myxococcota bacterium]
MTYVGPYLLGDVLGRGGMAEVRAVERDGEALALKWVDPSVGGRAVAAFAAEAGVMEGFDHPGVLPVLDRGVAVLGDALPVGAPWLVMPRAVGSLKGWRGPQEELRGWLVQLLRALAWAHARGVVHRDVKPSNLLIAPDGHLWLADFGVADALDRRTDGSPGGTPAYMAPERLEGERGGPVSDLYAVGCTAHALWTGRPPFGHGEASIDGHYYDAPPTLDLPFAAWVDRLLEKEPRDRFPTAAHALAALEGRPLVLGEWTGAPGAGAELWAHLRRAVDAGPVAVRATGDAVVREMARRAEAEGGVRVLHAVWADPPAAGDGLEGLLRRMGVSGRSVGDARAALAAVHGPVVLWLRGAANEAQALVARLLEDGPLPVLVLTEHGDGLPEVVCPPEPGPDHVVWRDPHLAFVAAAALGQRVDPGEWASVCERLGIEVPWELWERHRARGRIRLTAGDPHGGWAFVGLPSERVSVEVHRACAGELEERGAFARAARHRSALGETALARSLAVRAVRAAIDGGAPDLAQRALALALSLEDGTDLDLLAAEVALERRRPGEAAPFLERALTAGGAARAQAERDLGRVAWAARADVHTAIAHLHTALALAIPSQRCGIERHLGWMYLRAGDLDAAVVHLEAARQGRPRDVAAATWGLGDVARRRGDPQAASLLVAAIQQYRGLNARAAVATLTNTLGEVHRVAGNREGAREAYRLALDEGRAVGGATWFFPAYNLAVLDL